MSSSDFGLIALLTDAGVLQAPPRDGFSLAGRERRLHAHAKIRAVTAKEKLLEQMHGWTEKQALCALHAAEPDNEAAHEAFIVYQEYEKLLARAAAWPD
jgi:hypothetical protein